MRASLLPLTLTALLITACGGGGGSSGSNSGPDSGGEPATSDTVSLTATGSSSPVPAYSNTTLDFVVANNSKTHANSVSLQVTLGNGLTYAGFSCTATGGAICPANSGSLDLSQLPAGSSVLFHVHVNVAGGTTGSIASSAIVTAANDGVTSNNTAQVTINAYSADVAVSASTSAVAGDLKNGNVIPYAVTVANTGPDAARNVRIEAFLSDGQALDSVDCMPSGAVCPSASGADITVPELPSGSALVFTYHSRLSRDVPVSISSTYRLTAPGDSHFTNNTTTATAATKLPVSPASPTFVALYGDKDDWVGRGKDYRYDGTNAIFEAYTTPGELHFKVKGEENWDAVFYMPDNQTEILPGRYLAPLGRPRDAVTGGFSWGGGGNGCDHAGWVEIDDIVFANGELASLDLRFAQHCDDAYPAFRGQVHWIANDSTRPPGPVDPAPSGLWAPAPGATPASGNFVYIEGGADYPGLWGTSEVYTQADSFFIFPEPSSSPYIVMLVEGDRAYSIGLGPMLPLPHLVPGYYTSGPGGFGNPVLANLGVARGNTRGCLYTTGWFVVDSIAFSGDQLIALDARFEQFCDFFTTSLRGQIHWRHDDPTVPPGPVVPPPADLWAPPPGAVPATGTAIYMQSDPGDFVGKGITELYTPLNTFIVTENIGMVPAGNRFDIGITGDHGWTGYFQTMSTLPDLQVGYYGNALRFPMGNPARGSLSVNGEGTGCNELSGWFVIDSLTYTGSRLDAIQLRFEQHCEHAGPALRGFIRWERSDTRDPLPPVNPPPSGLWDAPPGVTPATGNYVYLESEAGDFVGEGKTYLYAPPGAAISAITQAQERAVRIDVAGGGAQWSAVFVPMLPFDLLQPGYYGDLNRGNPARGSFAWGGNGRGCGGAYGWFVVDAVSFDGANVVTAVDLRFEQRCYPTAPAMRGKVHWQR